ncbi:alpha/beta-hydrolase [Imleria badia]|nr:alpha/beta-hydrolase [Imleria badia]
MPNALTRTAGLKLGPIALDTLLKHYFDRVKKERAEDEHDLPFTKLRQDELLYDEAFNIAKRFFDVATHHSVEEFQSFSNTRTPSPPWVHVLRVTVPMSCCDEAATLLIQTLGGEENAFLLVGGTKWWQVRGVAGIAGEWVTARKDWEEAKKRCKKKKADSSGSSRDPADAMPSSVSEPSSMYDEDVADLRCILYAHGGGYYFGSLDQVRYCLQRLARKIKGRVFAINYRLAPQYPFPCALQDLVAAYLYLINPPPDAPHQPIKPSHIVVAGDSAGGGLTLALLQVLRDTGQPLPAGGVLISPWCDLTHSFPSIHTNTATDVLPLYGLSLHKPSALWPPPSEEMTHRIHTGLRRKIRQIVRVTGNKVVDTAAELTQDVLAFSKLHPSDNDGKSVSSDMPIDVGATTSLPLVDEKENQTISLQTKTGELLKVDSQIHLYTQNSLLGHPLVSPALSYLGGLPPLFVIASDKEVLRDEIIYTAHKAADPSRFPPRDEARALYPPLVGIEARYGPTQVHLQVYDDTAHVLPVLFPFTTPGKYCFRAMAAFTKHVTGMPPTKLTPSSSEVAGSPVNEDLPSGPSLRQVSSGDFVTESPGTLSDSQSAPDAPVPIRDPSHPRQPFSRPVFRSFQMKSVRVLSRSASEWPLRRGESSLLRSQEGQNVGSPVKLQRSVSVIDVAEVRNAGEASVYYDEEGLPSWKEGMIRERVSTQGVIRPLEPADKIDALHVPPAIIGVLSERALRRFLEGKAVFDQKYAKELLTIERTRKRNIELSKKDITRNLTQLQALQDGRAPGKQKDSSQAFRDGLESSTGPWGWAWADERPPPSSIVSRRDTDESRRLARIADQSVLQDEAYMNSNSLWGVIVKFLTTSSPKQHPVSDSEAVESPAEQLGIKKSKSMFASLRIRERQPKESD